MTILNRIKERQKVSLEKLNLEEYLDKCKDDSEMYASPHQRLLKAIGDPKVVDTSLDSRLARIFQNRKIKIYDSFKDFYGMEDVIEQLVNYLTAAAQGLEEANQILYFLGPVGGGKCERKGTKISMADGSLKNIEDIKKGDFVLSISSDEYLKLTKKEVTDTFIIEPKQVVELITRRGFKIYSADTHRYMTNTGWRTVSELNKNDFIATARKTNFGNISDTKHVDFLKVLAYLLGDGHFPKKGNLSFTNFNQEIIEDFKSSVRKMNFETSDQLDKDGELSYIRILEGNSIALRKKFKEINLLGTKSDTKFIPDFVFNLDEKLLSIFLSRLYGTDGWATVGDRCEIGYCTTSEQMAMQLVYLLSKFGIIARIHSKFPKREDGTEYKKAYQVTIRDKNDISIFSKKIGIFGKDEACRLVLDSISKQKRKKTGSLDRIPKTIIRNITENIVASKKDGTSKLKDQLRSTLNNEKGCRREFILEASEKLGNRDLYNIANSDLYWDEIKEINYLSIEEEMYDFEVSDFHNYIANGFISHNSSLAERLKLLMESQPFYAIEGCPIHESPLNLFDPDHDGEFFEGEFGISRRYLKFPLCPYCAKKLEENQGDASIFNVVQVRPSRLSQTAIAKTEPADESTQDISTLVGRTDISKLDEYPRNDPRAYSFCGGLNKANRGVLDFVEMFKAPIKTLNPLLTATQEGNYMGTEGFSAIPWDGIIVAHSNISEWDAFKRDKKNEAFIDRICLVRVPYTLVSDNVVNILNKLIQKSELRTRPCAPKTIEMLADWQVLTCLTDPENSDIFTKKKVYNGDVLKDTDPKAKSIIDYREDAGVDEGMTGMSTRFAFKVLSATYNKDADEISANPVYLMSSLLSAIMKEKLPDEMEEKYINFIKEYLQRNYIKDLEKELQMAYIESYPEYGQNMFNRYFVYADHWTRDEIFRDPDTDQMFDREQLNNELEGIEKAAGIGSPKEYRNEIVNYINRFRANNNGDMPKWNSYEKMREVIEAKIFGRTEDMLPVISFGVKKTDEEEEKHKGFVDRMLDRGYTEKTIRILVEYYMRVKKSN